MILNDIQIAELARAGMIRPFQGEQVRAVGNYGQIAELRSDGMIAPCVGDEARKVISYGLSSFGYDLRLGWGLQMFTLDPYPDEVIDPKRFNTDVIEMIKLEYPGDGGAYFTLPPMASALGHSSETLDLPVDVFALCVGKSTYARCGLIVNTTPLEPGWRGQLVIEIHNTTPLPIRVYANEGIAQLVFFRGERPAVTYGDRQGKYQGQTGITTARI